MSPADPNPNRITTARPAPLHVMPTFVEANELLQSAIQQLPAAVRSEIVLRCDNLARLQISKEALQQAFAQLLQLIVEKRTKSRLFLHITCSKEKEQQVNEASLSRFLIRFHANLAPHSAWVQEAEQRINNIASLLLPFGGSLSVNQLKNSGCVFIITLPGK